MKFWKRIIVTSLLSTFALTTFLSTPFASQSHRISAQLDAQEQEYENLDSPVDLLASYYNAINRQEYERAYGYWETAPDSFEEFANGFADTVNVQLIVQPPTRIEGAAGSLYVAIPTVLIAEHTDDTQHLYSGSFVTRKSNLQTPDILEEEVWHIYSASVVELPTTPTDLAAIPTLLAEACEQ